MRSYGPATTKPAQAVQARPEPTPAPAGPAPKKTKKKKKKRSLASMALPPILIIAAAVAAAIFLVSFYFMDGTSMGDTLRPGDALLSVHTDFSRLSQGDIISYDLEGKGMVKRVIAISAQTVDISDSGVVTVDGKEIDESYLGTNAAAKGQYDVEFPYVVPAGRVFVMGDDRENSIDSRALSAGCVSSNQVTGKVVLRFWPLSSIGPVE